MAIAIGDEFGFSNPYIGFDVDQEQVEFCQREITSQHPKFRTLKQVRVLLISHSPRMISQSTSVSQRPSSLTRSRMKWLVTSRKHTECCIQAGTFLSTWFCIQGGKQDLSKKPRFVFKPQRTYLGGLIKRGNMVAHLDNPAKAVAYHMSKAQDLLRRAGFKETKFYKGMWDGNQGHHHSQDVIVAKR